MGSTMTEKILARNAGVAEAKAGDILVPKVAVVTILDGEVFIKKFEKHGLKLWDPSRVVFCFDHFFQREYLPLASIQQPRIRRFAREAGIPQENVYDVGRNGLSHQVPVEQGWALPGTVCVVADSQGSTMGGVNCLSIPAVNGVSSVLLTGDIWMEVPRCVEVSLHGELPEGLTGKDVAYHILRELEGRVDGCVVEFTGPAIKSLSVDVRLAIANISAQTGSTTMIFPFDSVLEEYMDGRAREPYEPAVADPDADYAARYSFDLSTFEHLVAGPHEITLLRPLDELVGTHLDAVNIGSCSSGRLSDLALAARVLTGRRIAPNIRMVVTPISATVAADAARLGITTTLLEAGAVVTQPGCGGCYVGNLSPLSLGEGERCLSTSVETVRGRMGSSDSEVLLASAAVAAASAIEGRIADPAPYLEATRELARS